MPIPSDPRALQGLFAEFLPRLAAAGPVLPGGLPSPEAVERLRALLCELRLTLDLPPAASLDELHPVMLEFFPEQRELLEIYLRFLDHHPEVAGDLDLGPADV